MNKISAIIGAALFAGTLVWAAPDNKKDDDCSFNDKRCERGKGFRGEGPGGGMGPGMEMQSPPPFIDDLDLTDAQKAKLKAQRDKNEEAFIDLRAGLQKAELRLRQALEAQPIDEAKLKAAREDLVNLNAKQLDFRIEHMRFFLSVLTPEQRKKLDANMPDAMMGKHKGRKNKDR